MTMGEREAEEGSEGWSMKSLVQCDLVPRPVGSPGGVLNRRMTKARFWIK